MAACKECGEDHIEAAAQAAIAFEQMLRLMADPHKNISPSVMLHVYGLMGALLVHYSPYSRAEIDGEVTRVAENEEMVQGLYDNMLALGLVAADAPPEDAPPEDEGPVH